MRSDGWVGGVQLLHCIIVRWLSDLSCRIVTGVTVRLQMPDSTLQYRLCSLMSANLFQRIFGRIGSHFDSCRSKFIRPHNLCLFLALQSYCSSFRNLLDHLHSWKTKILTTVNANFLKCYSWVLFGSKFNHSAFVALLPSWWSQYLKFHVFWSDLSFVEKTANLQASPSENIFSSKIATYLSI